jgi:hypothetical protein
MKAAFCLPRVGDARAYKTAQGFGSRLLALVARDLGGDARIDFDPSGVRYEMTARL